MTELLEAIATNDAAVLARWAEGYAEHAAQLDALPQDKRGRELLTLARTFTRRAAWAADTAEEWRKEFVARLRIGMGGHKIRPLLTSGRQLCGTSLSVLEISDDLWRLAELASAPADEVREARNALAAAGQCVAKVEAEIAAVAKKVERPFTEKDWARLEAGMARGKQQIEQGLGMTPEQARAAIRESE